LERAGDDTKRYKSQLDQVSGMLKENIFNNILNLHSLDASKETRVNDYISFLWQNVNIPLNHLFVKREKALSSQFLKIAKLNFQFADQDNDHRLNFRDFREFNKRLFSTDVTVQD